MKYVLYLDDNPLMLEAVTLNKDGRVESARVVNGGWLLHIVGNEVFVHNGKSDAKTRYPFTNYELIKADIQSNDYTNVINRTDEIRAAKKVAA